MKSLNLDLLVKVSVFDRKQIHWYKWKPDATALFGLYKRKAGFYNKIDSTDYLSQEEAQAKYIVIGTKLYLRPYVLFQFANPNCNHKEEYPTLKKAKERCQQMTEMLKDVHWLTQDDPLVT